MAYRIRYLPKAVQQLDAIAEQFGRPVDLVRERNVTNPNRIASIRRDRRPLYAT